MTIMTSDRTGKNKLLIEFHSCSRDSDRQPQNYTASELAWPMKLQKTQPPRTPIIFLSSTYCINQCNCWEQNTFFFRNMSQVQAATTQKNYGQTSRAFPSKQMRERISYSDPHSSSTWKTHQFSSTATWTTLFSLQLLRHLLQQSFT